jgi:hypothetical protein
MPLLSIVHFTWDALLEKLQRWAGACSRISHAGSGLAGTGTEDRYPN